MEIASVNPRTGVITYDLNHADGTAEQAPSDKIRFQNADEALLHERAASYNTNQARVFVENYRDGQNVDNYAREWNLYSNYGRMALNLDTEKMDIGGTLTNEQKIAAYEQGLNARIAHNQVQTIVNSVNELKPYTSQNQGTFSYNVPTAVRLTKAQTQMKGFFRDMAAVTGLNIEMFQSQTDANGNFIGENGSYDPSTNALRVDINAGLNRIGEKKAYQYSMLNLAAHELTHVAKQGNKYENLREAVIAALGTTEKKFSALVEKKFNQLRGNERYQNLTDKELMELADEEVICDSCETMLQGNTKFFENLYQKDRNLAKSFVDAIKKLVEKIKAFVTGRKHADTEYGKALLEIADDLYNQVQQLWNEAVESGLETMRQQSAEKRVADDGVKYMSRNFEGERNILSFRDKVGISKAIQKTRNEIKSRNMEVAIDDTLKIANSSNVDWESPKEKRDYLKSILSQALGIEIDLGVDDHTITARLTREGLNHAVKGQNNRQKALIYQQFIELAGSSIYSYSTDQDNEHSNASARIQSKSYWDSFLAIANLKDESYSVIFTVRSIDSDIRGQIYDTWIKKETKAIHSVGTQNTANEQPNYDSQLVSKPNISQSNQIGNTSTQKNSDRTAQIEGSNFKKWFGDWQNDPKNASKVVDKDGKPLMVYHGTARADRVGNVFLPERATSGPMAFFTDSKDMRMKKDIPKMNLIQKQRKLLDLKSQMT